jgi:hypothetical protein
MVPTKKLKLSFGRIQYSLDCKKWYTNKESMAFKSLGGQKTKTESLETIGHP